MIFQDPFASLNPVKTVAHHIERPLKIHRLVPPNAVTARVHELLTTVGLVPPDEIARSTRTSSPAASASASRSRARSRSSPSVILADEPISMLDVSIRIGILNLMADLKRERGIAFLYITHDIASARYVADEVLVMYAGQIVEQGPTDAVLHDPLHPYTRLLLSGGPEPRARRAARAVSPRRAQRAVDPRRLRSSTLPARGRGRRDGRPSSSRPVDPRAHAVTSRHRDPDV